MSNQKLKSENYNSMGGIDAKNSPYLTGPMEFLDLANFDFQTPGSLSQRWGSTQYIGQTCPGKINSLFEFSKLDGLSQVVFSFSGGIFAGATTGQSQGLSFTLQSATFASFYFPTLVKSVSLFINQQTSNRFCYQGDIAQLTDSDFRDSPSAFYANPMSAGSNNILSYAVLDNWMFACDGAKFFKYDGTTTFPVGCIQPTKPFGSSNLFGFSGLPDPGTSLYLTNLTGASDLIGFPQGASGNFFYAVYASYVNNRGFESPLTPLYQLNVQMLGSTIAAQGGTFLAVRCALSTPLQYGISAINQYVFCNGASPFQTDTSSDTSFWNGYGGQMRLVSQTPASGSTITWLVAGSTAGGASMLISNGGVLPPTNSYQPLGLTALIGPIVPGASQPGPNVIQEIDLVGFYPRFIETYQNRLFLGGFSAAPSTVWFSDIAEPEGYAPDFNFEVRTNDSDVVTAMKAYATRLYVFKQKSFHLLSGDNPNNFFLQQVTDQYGCLNNRCAVIYDDILVFLDQKGVMMWNGASISDLSFKIKPIFDRMNFSAALTEACMVHDKLRNQILVAIPVDGSSTNNITAVYDYRVGAWTTYKGVNISALAQIQGRNNSKNAFYGDYDGRVNWFGPSFLGDNGAGFTGYLKSRFLQDLGESTQKMFRRLYINADAPSATLVFNINFFSDFGSSVVKSVTMYLGQFQNRIDFGISGKSLAFELSNLQSAIPLRIHGFTIESRFMRRT